MVTGARASTIEKRCIGLGGEVRYGSKVEKILVEGNRAVGIRLEDGSEHRADYVVSAADGHATIFDWLEGKYVDETIRGYYEKLPLFPALVLVALGVNRRFGDVPVLVSSLHIELPEPLRLADCTLSSISLRIFNNDPTLAPEGHTTLLSMFPSDSAWWKDIRQDESRYRQVKAEVAERIIAALDRRFPGLGAQVEMRDVATPLTFERYTGNWKGSSPCVRIVVASRERGSRGGTPPRARGAGHGEARDGRVRGFVQRSNGREDDGTRGAKRDVVSRGGGGAAEHAVPMGAAVW